MRRVWNTGHLYFTLKDGASQIKAVMFRSAVRYLKFKPEDGLKVVARGKISVYDPKGEYQILCEHMEPKGLGSLQQAFEQLKKKLAAEGLFDPARKRPLPALPRRIGLVTSIDGAALRDIIRVLRRRYPNAHLVISPTRVQGEGAGREVAHAIRKVARIEAVDVIIVARGGGSLEDLWAFNEEVLARAIAASPVPVISGVGPRNRFHDLRFRRRPARADAVGGGGARRAAEGRVLFAHRPHRRAPRCGDSSSIAPHGDAPARARGASGLRGLRRPARRSRPPRVGVGVGAEAAHQPGRGAARRAGTSCCGDRSINSIRAIGWRRSARAWCRATASCSAAVRRRMNVAQTRLGALAARIEGLSPLAVLGRGYSVTWDASRTRIIRDASTLKAGDKVSVTLERGAFDATVTRVRSERE